MVKRFLLSAPLFILISIGLCYTANAQDSTKKAEPEKKVETVQQPVIKRAKPLYHYHRMYPAANTTRSTAQPVVQAPAKPAATPANDSAALKAQADPAQLNDKSLNAQYQYLLSKVYHYQQPLIVALWKNVNDSLNHQRGQLKALQAKLSVQTKAVDSLKTDVNTKQQTLAESTAKVDSISMFGIDLAKSTYNLIMFGLVIGLAIVLTVVILTTTKYKLEAKHRIELYDEIDEEYKNFKAKANEKEKKLARELQTERNKLDELLGRG